MASSQTQISSGSDGDLRYAKFDERKRKRMISNRESARRSRMKKQQRVDELFGETSRLQSQNKVVTDKINQATDMFVSVASENNVLRAQLSELSDRLYSLNTVLSIVEEVSGLAMDIPRMPEPWQIPDALMEPWQQPITAYADMFNC
ncbi:Common plant regulatory factor 6 [Heracleum sosnowskyi]|uniref:Common plant regulatory factor 6 n=1 Tax=Heracleum sosnowskyi TaxID=360622 RepID=A0AAD8M284_9APIA|nr:Common plant regulatory factor 6 [Heracleum sosnowskyi]